MFRTFWRSSAKPAVHGRYSKRKARRRRYAPRLETLADRCLLTTFTVMNVSDSGEGSLRQAIIDSHNNPGQNGPNTIDFMIGQGLQVISPAQDLPLIFDPVVIDGTTVPGQQIELDGSSDLEGTGLSLVGPNITVRGLSIVNFS